MIGLPANTRIWIATGVTDMCCSLNGLAKVEAVLSKDPFSRHGFDHRAKVRSLLILWIEPSSASVCRHNFGKYTTSYKSHSE